MSSHGGNLPAECGRGQKEDPAWRPRGAAKVAGWEQGKLSGLFLQSIGRVSGSDIPAHYGSQALLQVWGRVRAITTGVQEGLVWAQADTFPTVTAGSAHGLTLHWACGTSSPWHRWSSAAPGGSAFPAMCQAVVPGRFSSSDHCGFHQLLVHTVRALCTGIHREKQAIAWVDVKTLTICLLSQVGKRYNLRLWRESCQSEHSARSRLDTTAEVIVAAEGSLTLGSLWGSSPSTSRR